MTWMLGRLERPRFAAIDRQSAGLRLGLEKQVMTMSRPSLYLITPLIDDPAAFAPDLAQACEASGVEAVLLRFPPQGERGLINAVKALAPIAQNEGIAVILADPGDIDLSMVVTRGGADGGHADTPERLAALHDRLKGERNTGAGQLSTKHDAMVAGEAGVDYVLFGEPRADGTLPPLDLVEERAAWWAEIFQTPCVAYAPTLEALPRLATTGADFIALGDAVWTHPAGPRAALAEANRLLAAIPEDAA